MAVNQLEVMFSTDTPPSDFDDLDLSTLLACSPTAPRRICLTPDSIHRPHSSSLSSESACSSYDSMSFQGEQATQEMYFSPSESTSFYPVSVPPNHNTISYNLLDGYSTYEQSQWLSHPDYSQAPTYLSYTDAPPSSVYPTFDAPSASSNAKSILPTPHSMSETFTLTSGPLDPLVSQVQYAHSSLALSPAHSRHSQTHSNADSISSSSRSSSPNPSLFRAGKSARPRLTTSKASSSTSCSMSNLHAYGIPVASSSDQDQSSIWRCAYPNCASRALFHRGCDLRKHYNRHSKHLFCRVEGCPQSAPRDLPNGRRGSVSATGGFSSKKDRARHEAKHNPGIRCEWQGVDGEECGRVFSRLDNMKDHVKRIHRRGSR